MHPLKENAFERLFFSQIHKLPKICGGLVFPRGRRSKAEGFGLFKSSFRSVYTGRVSRLSCSYFTDAHTDSIKTVFTKCVLKD